MQDTRDDINRKLTPRQSWCASFSHGGPRLFARQFSYISGVRCVHGPLKDNHVITKNKHKVRPSGRGTHINRKLKYNRAGPAPRLSASRPFLVGKS